MNWILSLTRISAWALMFAWGIASAQMLTPPANAQDQAMQQQLLEGMQLLRAGKIQDAIRQRFDVVINYYEQTYRKSQTRVYSSRSMPESLMYMLDKGKAKEQADSDAAVYSSNWGDAYYLKAYALIELKQTTEAKTALLAAVALAPYNAQYLGELGNLNLMERDWVSAKKIFEDAEKAAREFSPADTKTTELTRALRGQGFVLIETNRLDEAEARYRASLEADANDTRARTQLAYIQQRRTAAVAGQLASTSIRPTVNLVTIEQAWSAAEAQNADPAAQGYARKWTLGGSIWNDNGIQKRAVLPSEKAILECVTAIFPAPESARMVFALDEKGVVTTTFSDQTGYVGECMQSKLQGHRMPSPPKAPFYLCTQYQKQGDTGSITAGCGPRHVATVCERQGTSTSCTVVQK